MQPACALLDAMAERDFTDIPDGARITDLRPLPSDPNVLRVRAGGRVVARLRAAAVEKLGLAPGQPWTDELADRVQEQVSIAKARQAALNLLGRRAYSAREVRDRLRRRNFADPVVNHVIDELTRDGWLDDAAYARAVAAEIIRGKPAGPRLIESKLRARGVDPSTAEHAAREVLADIDPVDTARELVERRLTRMGGQRRATIMRRLTGLLARRGFDHDVIERVLRDADIPDDDEQGQE